MAFIFVFSSKNAIRIFNLLSCEFKKGLKVKASGIETSVQDNKFLLTLFLWEKTYLKLEIVHKGEKCSFRNTSQMQKIEFVG